MNKNNLPVSKKVYADITARVNTVLSFVPASVVEAIALVDSFLAGNADPVSSDSAAMIAFNMIKAELERAMERSSRARQRAHRRKEVEKSDEIVSDEVVSVVETCRTTRQEDLHHGIAATPCSGLSRRERRAMERRKKSKRRNLYDRVGTLVLG